MAPKHDTPQSIEVVGYREEITLPPHAAGDNDKEIIEYLEETTLHGVLALI